MDLLRDTGLMGCKPSAISMDPLKRLQLDSGVVMTDPSKYRILIGGQLHLLIIRLDVIFAVHKLIQFISKLCIDTEKQQRMCLDISKLLLDMAYFTRAIIRLH